jgi:hypothetical protein
MGEGAWIYGHSRRPKIPNRGRGFQICHRSRISQIGPLQYASISRAFRSRNWRTTGEGLDFENSDVPSTRMVWYQFFSRCHARLPITLLESITIGQIVYASVLYIFWYYKPQGIKKPVELDFRYCRDCQDILQKDNIWADFESKPAMGTTEVADMKCVRLDPANHINRWGLFSIVMCGLFDVIIVATAPRGQGFVTTGEYAAWWCGLVALIVGKLFIGWSAGLAPADMSYFKKRQVLYFGIIWSVSSKLLFFITAVLSFRTLPVEAYVTPKLTNLLPHVG